MHNAIMTVLFLIVSFTIMSFVPKTKRDYSHVPKEYKHLVHFAESAGY